MPIGILIGAIAVGCIGLASVLYFLVQGAPYVPTQEDDVAAMLQAVGLKKQPRIIDLGAGDGRLVLAFARHGYHIDGIEIKPWLVWRARKRIAREKLTGIASMARGNLWNVDTNPYDVVLLYAVPHVMGRLEKKLMSELKPGSLVVSNYFALPNLTPSKTLGRIKVYEVV